MNCKLFYQKNKNLFQSQFRLSATASKNRNYHTHEPRKMDGNSKTPETEKIPEELQPNREDSLSAIQGRERRNSLPPLNPHRVPPIQSLHPTLSKSSSTVKLAKQPSRPNSRGLSSGSLSGSSQIPDLDVYTLLQKKEGDIAQEEQGLCFAYRFIPPKEVDLQPVVSKQSELNKLDYVVEMKYDDFGQWYQEMISNVRKRFGTQIKNPTSILSHYSSSEKEIREKK